MLDRQRAEWALSYKCPELILDPEYRRVPAEVRHSISAEYRHIYYSPLRPVLAAGLFRSDEARCAGRWVFTREILSAERVTALELVPYTKEAKGALAVEYARECWGEAHGYLLYKDDPDRMAWWAWMITPSITEPGRWQVTRVDEYGPSGHHMADTLEDAVGEAILRGFMPVPPNTLDGYEFTPLQPAST